MRRRWVAIIGYLATTAIVVVSMFATRVRTIEQLSTPRSIAEWQAWRDDVRLQQTRPGPVTRRVPQSSEPPALVLMRDYFAVSLTGALLFSTALYWVIAWFVAGVVSQNSEAK
jgi:hypothetical protein